MDVNQSASRDARRYLAERVRNDWTFPPAPSAATTTAAADESNAAAASASDANNNDDDGDGSSEEELRGVTEFRERYYGSTDDDNDDDDEPSDEGEHNGEAGGEEGGAEYKFDSPEHVGRSLEERAQRRRRRRRRALEEEMRWNEGVAVFVRRRDAWTGAASVRKYARRRSRTSSEMMPQEVEAHTEVVRLLEETAVVEEEEVGGGEADAPEGEAVEKEEKAGERIGRINIDVPASEEPLVPLAPPLLAQNSIRQSITPKAYSDIYSKIVVAGQTPKVPINLSHMTRALVQGWKDDGEWPPRPGPVDPLMGRKKIAAAGGRVGTLAAVLGGGSGGGEC
ncbi:putative mitochondrial aaa atpase protein [Neofusicoccum parvum UCRNP2]|uniref:Putative mitochondrial aaa atpase protein n=1 Tax=Botryosphaeria parva (strain UCR-NP2) TaxID=1287680 RepID=R1GDT6_BOTPV|nr:putative mitochondrial aaa atpase protein [Neofusicoccum parvum UCRNP2]